MSWYDSLLGIIQNRLFDRRLWLALFIWSGFLIFIPDSIKSPFLHISLLPPEVGIWVGLVFLFACSFFLSFILIWIVDHFPRRRYKRKILGEALWYYNKYTGEPELQPRCIKHKHPLQEKFYRQGTKAFSCPDCPKDHLIAFSESEYSVLLDKVIDYFKR
jgi:hypothetical protein